MAVYMAAEPSLIKTSDLESINAVLLHQELPQNERSQQLNKTAISRMRSLTGNKQIKKL
ncbi:hypothetical protein [Segetibacter sp.]|uniref:hypothetical protein n=1 Tax=Segetibacter sp. TaxID=2231182 RepID=UPI0026209467|nr:hypothetical protein [Segetibacter sp.]